MSTFPLKPCPTTRRKKAREFHKMQTFPPWSTTTICPDYVSTRRLIEVFQVCVDKFDDVERRGELYGNIEVVDLDGPITLYHRDRANPEHIRANCNVTLTSPPCAIPFTTGFSINVDLRLCGDLEDIVLSKWQLSWNVYKPEIAKIARGPFLIDFSDDPKLLLSQASVKNQSAGYEQPLSAVFESPNGCCITMYYSIFYHAVQAQIQIEIVDLGTAPVAEFNFRGSISARYGNFWCGNDSAIKDYCKITLLKSGDLQLLKSKRCAELQLSRSIIAVPAYSSLIIEADLWDTSGFKIAKGKVELAAYDDGYGAGYIRGDANFGIRVIVSWAYGSQVPRFSSF